MATPHNRAEKGQIASTVIMPGDPLRAKFIAEKYLENPVLFTDVRNMYGYTGTYEGVPVSVMGSGMGMPSMGIYSYELFQEYGVETIIRVGSAGAYSAQLDLFDTLLVTESYSESSYAYVQNGYDKPVTYPCNEVNEALKKVADKLGKPLKTGKVHSSDVFYRMGSQDYYKDLLNKEGCLAVEMESFALFQNAAACGKKAACLLTISDSFVSKKETTAEQREQSFTDMMEIALGFLKI